MADTRPMNVGLSYRPNFRDFCFSDEGRRLIGHLEMPVEHIMGYGSASAAAIRLARIYPVILHGVSQSFGSAAFPPRADSTRITRRAVELLRPAWAGDHLSTSLVGGLDSRQLLPVERSAQMATALAQRAEAFRRAIGIPVVLEYIAHSFDPGGTLSEVEFINSVIRACNCGLLLDLHNVYANSINFDFDPFALLAELPLDRVEQIHIAGGEFNNGFYFDSHDASVPDVVWALLAEVLARIGPTATTLERDGTSARQDDIAADLETAIRIAEKTAHRPWTSAPQSTIPRRKSADSHEPNSGTGSAGADDAFENSRKARTCSTIRKNFPLSWKVAEPEILANWQSIENVCAQYATVADKAAAATTLIADLVDPDEHWRVAVDTQLSLLVYAEDSGEPIVVKMPAKDGEIILRRNPDLTITVKHRATDESRA
ncbi:DUF692 family multinuclear iron-containing protein [Nocardia sp. NPDC019395]|uniref:DUF692 domain-containing protein n=1 Tax=Nocardia sp. NPDC019395 TaxID=3154686 RepID=UPI003402F0A2